MKKNQVTLHEIGDSKINHSEKTKKLLDTCFFFIIYFNGKTIILMCLKR